MTLRIGITLIVSLVLVGCSDSSNNGRGQGISVDFTTFVKNEIKQTDNVRAPINVNRLEFRFNDQDNEQAYDDLF